MAEAVRKVLVEKQVIVTEQVEYTLRLTEAEARTLMAIYMAVGGCPSKSPRKHVDAIASALSTAGLYSWGLEDGLRARLRVVDGIYFNEYPAHHKISEGVPQP